MGSEASDLFVGRIDKIIEILEGHDISEDKIVQIVSQLKESSENRVVKQVPSSNFLEAEIENEKNPLKKSALVAKMISKSFDE